MHDIDGNECEARDNAGEEGFEGCRQWRWVMFIREVELPESIVKAARAHFTSDQRLN